MKPNIIRMMRPVSRVEMERCDRHYELRGDRPHQWLQRLCIRVLDKLGCHAFGPRDMVEYQEIRVDSIIKQMLEYRDIAASVEGRLSWAFRQTGQRRSRFTLLVGNDQVGEVTRALWSAPGVANYMIRPRDDAGIDPITGRESIALFADMLVVHIPYMTGMVVIPHDT